MGLTSYRAPTTNIPLGKDNSFTVRGLGLDDFSVLIANHLSAITQATEAYELFQRSSGKIASMQGFFMILLKEYPGLMSEVISIAADEPDAKNIRLPMAIQTSALSEIGRLTLTDAGGLGNLLAMLATLLKGVGAVKMAASLEQALSNDSIGDLERSATSSSQKDT
jgi:hypothetical protein